MCAAPSYLAERGWPQAPQDPRRARLAGRAALRRRSADTPLLHSDASGETVTVPVTSRAQAGRVTALHALCVAGWGISVVVSDDDRRALADGRARCPVLPLWHLPDLPVYAITPRRGEQPAKVRHALVLLEGLVCPAGSAAGLTIAGGYRIDTPLRRAAGAQHHPRARRPASACWSADDFWRALHEGVNRARPGHVPGHALRLLHSQSRARTATRSTPTCARSRRCVNAVRRQPAALSRSTSAGRWRCGASCTSRRARFKPDPAKPASVEPRRLPGGGPGHCSACHSPRNALGGIEKDKAYTGASIDGWFALEPLVQPAHRPGQLDARLRSPPT
ncbi:MAG: LysR substrate-binding domain-containing protein [Chromatiales bacterium]|nr:LysR substrate-binding domain-containing protein [Chromatiales bacterium]